jgi:hypothetical protein
MKGRKKVGKRRGKPFIVYFNKELADKLKSASQERSVAKAVLVRLAVERLLNQLGSGQLELPLGL